jgi:hypothetical protein
VLHQYPGTSFLQEEVKTRSNRLEHSDMLEKVGQLEQDPDVGNIEELCDQSCHKVGRLA